jgi:hypothetical protein
MKVIPKGTCGGKKKDSGFSFEAVIYLPLGNAIVCKKYMMNVRLSTTLFHHFSSRDLRHERKG